MQRTGDLPSEVQESGEKLGLGRKRMRDKKTRKKGPHGISVEKRTAEVSVYARGEREITRAGDCGGRGERIGCGEQQGKYRYEGAQLILRMPGGGRREGLMRAETELTETSSVFIAACSRMFRVRAQGRGSVISSWGWEMVHIGIISVAL